MVRTTLPRITILLVALSAMPPQPGAAVSGQSDSRALIGERMRMLTRVSAWRLVKAIPVQFRTHHPQGMVKIGHSIFVSSVEVKVPTRRYPEPVGPHDRDPGAGTGHLFKMDVNGRLLQSLELGEGSIYHPGGIDFDGRWIWVSVAEYRPNSRSIVYRVDPERLRAVEVFRFADHLGAIIHDTRERALHAVSWGSRRFYRWRVDADGTVAAAGDPASQLRTPNPSHYVDYQDCKYAGEQRMLCSGVTELRPRPDAPPFRFGGLDLVSLTDGRPLHQVPVPLWTDSGLAMTQNPMWMEPNESGGLRVYFMPEDDKSTLYVYEVNTGG